MYTLYLIIKQLSSSPTNYFSSPTPKKLPMAIACFVGFIPGNRVDDDDHDFDDDHDIDDDDNKAHESGS